MKEFPPFRLDAVNQCLWRDNQRIALTPKAFSVLQYLVEHAGRLVTQSELLDALWTETFVQPEVLKSHILDVRGALGDDAKHPSFIETLPRRGYRFIATVRECHREDFVRQDSPPVDLSNGTAGTREWLKERAETAKVTIREQASLRSSPTWRWMASGSTLLALGLCLGWMIPFLHQPPADERILRFQVEPPEVGRFVFGASTGGSALSPDGRTAAYVASNNGKTGLWVRPLDSTRARLLPGTEGASYPFWLPDNKSIAFFTTSNLERVELAGGSPLVICEVAVARGGAWSSQGHILFATATTALFQVPASGGTPSALTTLDSTHGEASHRWPQILPGGRFLYWVQSDKPETTGVYAASLSKPADRVRLMTSDTNALYAPGKDAKNYLLWLRGGTLFAEEFDVHTLKLRGEPYRVTDPVASSALTGQMNVAASVNGLLLYSDSNASVQLTWLDRAGKSLGVVGEPGEYNMFSLSRDGRRVVLSRDRPGATDLWLLEKERGVFTRFTSNSSINLYPVWSPDGRTILLSSGNSRNLFRKQSSGAGDEELIQQSPNIQGALDWSRDGRFVLYVDIGPRKPWGLWILPVTPDGRPTAGTKSRPYLGTRFNESWGRFSPEATPHWVAYQSDESGRYEIYVQAFPEPRGATRISTRGGQYPQWGPGGRELFYVSPENKLMSVNLKLAGDVVQPSAPREMFPLPAEDLDQSNLYCPYEVDPDGRRFLVRATSHQAAKPLTVIVNWPAVLKRGATGQ